MSRFMLVSCSGATVAQVVERLIRNQGVSGSSPLSGSIVIGFPTAC